MRPIMETPHLPRAIFADYFKDVYEPAEDTFLLLDAMELDLKQLKQETSVCLECGSGSGTVITALSRAFSTDDEQTGTNAKNTSRLFLATDINARACEATRKCAQYHNQNNVQVIRTNLADALVDRLENSVDLIVFNPPYVPTEDSETIDSELIQLAWAGSKDGRKLIDVFLKSYVTRLMKKPSGVAYMVALDKNNIDNLLYCLKSEHNIQGNVVLKRQAGIECLYVIRYNWIIS